MENVLTIGYDRVRAVSPKSANNKIDRETLRNLRRYTAADGPAIRERLRELNHEWDVERFIELHAAQMTVAGVVLSLTVSKKWLILPAFIGVFLGLHAIQGWCPPVPILRKLGIRTQKEIEAERHALLRLLEAEQGSIEL